MIPNPFGPAMVIFFRKVNCLGTIWTQITDVIQHDAYVDSILEAISRGGLLFAESNYGLDVSRNLASLLREANSTRPNRRWPVKRKWNALFLCPLVVDESLREVPHSAIHVGNPVGFPGGKILLLGWIFAQVVQLRSLLDDRTPV